MEIEIIWEFVSTRRQQDADDIVVIFIHDQQS